MGPLRPTGNSLDLIRSGSGTGSFIWWQEMSSWGSVYPIIWRFYAHSIQVSTVVNSHTTSPVILYFCCISPYPLPCPLSSPYPLDTSVPHPSLPSINIILFPFPWDIWLPPLIPYLCFSMDYRLTCLSLTFSFYVWIMSFWMTFFF